MEQLEEDKELQPLLSSFCCEQDKDIEHFLHNRAVEFERLSKSRTYIVCDLEELQTKRISELTVYGYLTLALKILTIPTSASNRTRKELDGFSWKLHGKQIQDFPCYLIGQLARNSQVPHYALTGKQLLDFANDIIAAAVDAVGGRYLMIECRDIPGLLNFYKSNAFDEISRVFDAEQPMVQMIRKLQ